MIFVLCGPGGVGKGTVASRLVERIDSLELSRSWTTRMRRDQESESAYTFVDTAQFKSAIDRDQFVEWAWFLDNLYGTPMPDASVYGCSDHLLLEIDVQGAAQIKDRVPGAVIIVLLPPSDEELRDRLRKRGDDERHVEARSILASKEIAAGIELGAIPVVNANLDDAVDEIVALIRELIANCA